MNYNALWYARNKKKRDQQIKKYQQNSKKYQRYTLNYIKSHRKEAAERSRWWRFKTKYGLTKDGYFTLLKTQNFKCALCGKPLLKKKRIHIDHCHRTGKVRGAVHDYCNLVVAFSQEDITILKNAIKYLNKHSK